MISRLKYRLFASVSSLVAAALLLPAGCMSGDANECVIGQSTCADERTQLVCIGGLDGLHFTSKPCEAELHCEVSVATATCLGAREGESCVTAKGCFDQPYCLGGKCSPVPPTAASACSAAVELDMPTRQHEPDGAIIESTLEPGEGIVTPTLALAALDGDGRAMPCGPITDGPERIITIHVPVSIGKLGPLHLKLEVEGLDSSFNRVAMIALGTCGDPRTFLESTCAQQPSAGATLEFSIDATLATDVTFVLQSPVPLTKAVPFTLRARFVALNQL